MTENLKKITETLVASQAVTAGLDWFTERLAPVCCGALPPSRQAEFRSDIVKLYARHFRGIEVETDDEFDFSQHTMRLSVRCGMFMTPCLVRLASLYDLPDKLDEPINLTVDIRSCCVTGLLNREKTLIWGTDQSRRACRARRRSD